MDNPPKSVPYEEYRKQRPRPIGEFAQQLAVPTEEPCAPPVPQALACLDERIETLSKLLSELDEKLRPVSTSPLPETHGVAGAQLAKGNSEFARRVYDSRDRVDNLVNCVQRMIQNLEI